MKKVWFITGSSRGLGKSLATAVLASGDFLAATARQPEQLKELVAQFPGKILPIQLDVNNNDQINAAVAMAVKHFRKIDVLVNNAGLGIIGAAEAFTDDQVRSQLETNLYAAIAVTRAVLPHMRKEGSGRILQISSLGGRVGNAGLSIYQAAKFGLSGFSEAIAKELLPLGIYVTSVEPGGFQTDWAGDSMTYAQPLAGYESTVDQRVAFFKSGQFVPMGDPAKAANVIVALANHPEPPVHLLLGSEAVAILQHADAMRKKELQKWKDVSVSTDHDNAPDFLKTEMGKSFVIFD